MAQNMGPTISMAHILQKLTIIIDTMASFNVLMQNFYKVTKATRRRSPPLSQG